MKDATDYFLPEIEFRDTTYRCIGRVVKLRINNFVNYRYDQFEYLSYVKIEKV